MFGFYEFGIQEVKPKDTKVVTEAVSRRTDNTMIKGKRTDNTMIKGKKTNMIYKTLHRKQEIAQLKTGDELKHSGKVNSYCSTCGIP